MQLTPIVRGMALVACAALVGDAALATPVDIAGRPLWDGARPLRHPPPSALMLAAALPSRPGARTGGEIALPRDLSRAPRALSHSAFTLAPYTERAVGSWPDAVAVGDVTGDGRPDVVLTTTSYFDAGNDYHVFVFPQQPDGNLGATSQYPYEAVANRNGLVLVDLDEDGVLDVVVGQATGVSVLLADGAGGLLPAVVHDSFGSDALAVLDHDRDGHADVAGVSWNASAAIYHGTGLGTLERVELVPTNASGYNDLEAGDLDGDCVTDLAVMSGQLFATPDLTVHHHDGVSAFEPVPDAYTLDYNSGGLGLGDINGDGRHDAVVTRGGNRPTSLRLMEQDAAGILQGPRNIPTHDIPESVVVTDIDVDGTEDIIVMHGGWNAVGVYLQDPATGLEPEVLFPVPYASHYAPQGMAVGDINSDACPDVVIADYNHGLVVLLGQGCFTPPDADRDAVPDATDTCPGTADTAQRDWDCDSHGDACDNCPFRANSDQADADGDGIGDACEGCADDPDADGACGDADNCPLDANPGQEDLDSDGIGDACDPDRDGDGLDNVVDCAPDDARVGLPPGEVRRMHVAKTGSAPAAIRLSWTDERPAAGPGAKFDVVSGSLASLHGDRGFASSACLARDVDAISWDAEPSFDTWYLVRVTSACGPGTYGNGSEVPDPRDLLDDPSQDACR